MINYLNLILLLIILILKFSYLFNHLKINYFESINKLIFKNYIDYLFIY